jgi:hypothetical protein
MNNANIRKYVWVAVNDAVERSVWVSVGDSVGNSVENSIIDTVNTLASPVWRVAVNSVRYPIVNFIQDYFKQNE